jgi:hypothetical protein
MGKKLIKSSKFVGNASTRQNKSTKVVNVSDFKETSIEVGSTTSGAIYTFTHTAPNQWRILGDNVDTGHIIVEKYFDDEKKATLAWNKLLLSFHKQELERLKKRRKTIVRRLSDTSNIPRRRQLVSKRDELMTYISQTQNDITVLERKLDENKEE